MIRLAAWTILACAPLAFAQQEESSGISVPITGALSAVGTNGVRTDDGLESSVRPAFRVVVSPTVSLGSRWILYAAESVTSASYYNGSGISYDEAVVKPQLLQAFVGRSGKISNVNWLIRAGRLTSAFGLAPSKYDDASMPLVLPSPIYLSALPLRADQIPCGTADLLQQRGKTDVDFSCGGLESESYGISPVTLYGLPGFEIQLASERFDARVQITNSSPSNPQSLTSSSQRLQPTVGGGVRLPQGFHIGISGFTGPYLDHRLSGDLPPSRSWASLKASGLGVDLQWLHGPWSVDSEWQRFVFDSPHFTIAPSTIAMYAQAKRVISPRFFSVGRFSRASFGSVTDDAGITSSRVWPTRTQIDCGFGYHMNAHQVMKIAGGLTTFPSSGPDMWKYVATVELVTSFTALSRSFH